MVIWKKGKLLIIAEFDLNSLPPKVYNSYFGGIDLNGPVFHCSRLIFDPDRRNEIWRYFTYMLIHSGLFHAIFNISIQLVLGIPLEMVHGKQF